jgi:hypothetical protein
VILAYLGAHGPATSANLGRWLARGRIGARQLRTWFADLGDRLAEVEVDGEILYVRAEDVDDLAATRPSKAVRLLPGFDSWVLGPGTEDVHVLAPKRRVAVSRQSGWISPVVVAGGRVSGTWTIDDHVVRVDWFREAGRPPTKLLKEEVARLASVSGATLSAAVSPT